ncbi:MAG: 30S ribosomal protein S9 [Victivallaceae bacterium]|nr:30S ribosomal protein S9 [Victivallaceae bacterium]
MAIKKSDEVLAVGRRKCAVARVRLTPGTGKVVINGKALEQYFPSAELCGYIAQVFAVVDGAAKFDVNANIDGGGMTGQAGALRHGVARALVKYNEDYRPALKEAGMMTRDARVKERKKSGQPGARRRFQFSKR